MKVTLFAAEIPQTDLLRAFSHAERLGDSRYNHVECRKDDGGKVTALEAVTSAGNALDLVKTPEGWVLTYDGRRAAMTANNNVCGTMLGGLAGGSDYWGDNPASAGEGFDLGQFAVRDLESQTPEVPWLDTAGFMKIIREPR